MSKISVLFADGMEECEALLVVDIARRAGITVNTVSINKSNEVTSCHNITINADSTIDKEDFINSDMIVLPGGIPGTTNLQSNSKVCELVKEFAQSKKIAAICAAPIILGELNILKGRKATCYPGFEDKLINATYTGDKTTVDGNIITGKGMGAGIEFSLEIVKMLKGEDIAENVSSAIQYK